MGHFCYHFFLFTIFLLQGGDPTRTGKGGSNFEGGFQDDELVPALKHDRRGIVSFAHHQNQPNKIGSQFFITYAKQPHLNGVYTVFGRLIDGLDVLSKISRVSLSFRKICIFVQIDLSKSPWKVRNSSL
jgi:cyclophilin family peptidyl-prolyl cis-trans isomerase